jgi:hypothetical protein
MNLEKFENRNPAVKGLLKFFAWEHLPEHLQLTSKLCGELAETLTEGLPDSPELTTGLRKLLEAKDCFVRAAL